MSKPGFPIWWENTITIYNKYAESGTDRITWYRTVITDCFWHLAGTEVTVGETSLDGKSIVCRIPKDTRFKDKSEWVQLPSEEIKNYFTIGQGDIIIKGESTFEINEYVAGQRSTDLLAKYREYQQCMEITQYADDTGLGRNNEHYLVRGK